jgi:DNA-binding MarR family transcriptional regulator
MQSGAVIGSIFGHVASMLHRQSDQMLQERLGIGMSQFNIMSTIEQRPQTKQRALAHMLGQTEASVSRQITLLKQKSLLTTHVDPAERRQHLAVLTVKGVKLTLAAREVLEQFYEQLLGGLSGREQEQLHSLLTKLHEQTCAPDKRLACDRPRDIETLYANQS